jgi:hypothetical protein
MRYDEIDQGDFAEIEIEPGHQYAITVRIGDRDTMGGEADNDTPQWHVIERQVPADPDA